MVSPGSAFLSHRVYDVPFNQDTTPVENLTHCNLATEKRI